MSDQNQFDQYKQKLLHYWALFLAGCGTLWEKVKEYTAIALEFLRRHGKELGRKLSALYKAAVQLLRELWTKVRPYCRRAVQIVAGWLLLAREKTGPLLAKAKVWLLAAAGKTKAWITAQIARFRSTDDALPAPEEARALPAGEADIPEAEPVEVAVEAEEIPAAAPAKELPAWMANPWVAKTLMVLGAVWTGIKFVVRWICKLYKVILAAPVVWYAIQFARENMQRLPEEVGLDIQASGEFARMISRQQAVYWPLGITMFCLLLMFLSKKPILPWIISIFTLVLPWLIWILNFYA